MTSRRTECECCGTPTGDSAALCWACTERFRDTLRTIIGAKGEASSPFDLDTRHGLAADLDLAITKQTSTSSNRGGKSGERVPLLPVDLRAARAESRLELALAAALAYLGEPNFRRLAKLAEDLLELVPTLRRHRGALEHVERIERAVDDAYDILDRKRLEYVGPCVAKIGRLAENTCTGHLRAEPGAETVTCQECGTGHDVADVRTRFAKLAAEQLLTVTQLARALTLANGQPVDYERVRQWIKRGRLEPSACDVAAGHALYRVADAQTVLASTTRRDTDTPRALADSP